MPTAVGTFAAVGFHAFSCGIEGRRFRSQPWQEVRTETCPLFQTVECRLRPEPLLLLVSTHSAAESKAEDSGPSPHRRCGPKPVRFFKRGECRLRSEPLLLLASTHSVAESKTAGSSPSPGGKCGPKPVRFLVATGSGMMVSGALAAERTSVVPSSTKRHGLCQ